MKPITTWPFVSTLCALATTLVGAVAAQSEDPEEGHPLPPLTTKRVEQSAFYGCTDEEIANLFVISIPYLIDRYGINLVHMRARRTYELRKAQFELATKKTNATMLIWLGRNEMNQTTHPQTAGVPEPEVED